MKVYKVEMTESLKNIVCERKVACEPAVNDEKAGAIAKHKHRQDCLIYCL